MFTELNNLKLFFEEPNREFHLRELARLMKRNPVTVKKYLEDSIKQNILRCRKERGLELYSSNTEDFYYKEYKKIYNRLKFIESGLLDYLKEEFSLPTIMLFGSYARGEDNKNSDVDVFILSEVKKTPDLSNFEKKITRTIQVHIFNRKGFEAAKKTNKELINNITNGTILHGFIEVL